MSEWCVPSNGLASCLLTAGLANTHVTPISNKQLFMENLFQIFIKVSGRDIFHLQVYIVSNMSAVLTSL